MNALRRLRTPILLVVAGVASVAGVVLAGATEILKGNGLPLGIVAALAVLASTVLNLVKAIYTGDKAKQREEAERTKAAEDKRDLASTIRRALLNEVLLHIRLLAGFVDDVLSASLLRGRDVDYLAAVGKPLPFVPLKARDAFALELLSRPELHKAREHYDRAEWFNDRRGVPLDGSVMTELGKHLYWSTFVVDDLRATQLDPSKDQSLASDLDFFDRHRRWITTIAYLAQITLSDLQRDLEERREGKERKHWGPDLDWDVVEGHYTWARDLPRDFREQGEP